MFSNNRIHRRLASLAIVMTSVVTVACVAAFAGPAAQEQGAQPAKRNPFAMRADELVPGKVDQALSQCVDALGFIDCGPYKGSAALELAALTARHGFVNEADSGALSRHGQKALVVAAGIGDLAMVKALINRGVEFGFFATDGLGHHPLFELERPDSWERIDPGMHPAQTAAEFGHLQVLRYFVERGFDVNTRFADGYQDLFSSALLGGHDKIVGYLLDHGYQLNCGFQFPNGVTYLELATKLSNKEILRRLNSRCQR